MDIFTAYDVKIKHYNHIFDDTLTVYRNAVDFLIRVCLNEWNTISSIDGSLNKRAYIESIIHKTSKRTSVKYAFDTLFYKFPCYLLRSAITEAIGKVSSYQSNLKNWEVNKSGKKLSVPKAGFTFPCLYRGNMFIQTSMYTACVKVFIRNTWDWIDIELRKSDVDYINRHCNNRHMCAPVLTKRGKQWFLTFAFEEKNITLNDTPVNKQTILAVDLGINNVCTVVVMKLDGTIVDRRFLKLSKEQDCLYHSLNRIKKAQKHGNKKTPRLWAKARGLTHIISVKTAQFIMDVAIEYQTDVIVFEYLNINKRKKGSKRQRIHHWRNQYVQAMVTNKAHRLGMHVRHVCARNTSKLAYDGSGSVTRGINGNYSLCQFATGKIYNCDLSAAYNIGARYYIREVLKTLNETKRLQLEAKVPQVVKRSTCTWSTLISLNAELAA